MTGFGSRFDPSELTDETASVSDAERLAALRMARELEDVAAREIPVGERFSDRVMAAIETEPTPQPTTAFGSALRGGRLGASLAAVRDAFRVSFGGGRPLAVRGQALALALVLIGVVGLGGGATVGALNALLPDATPSPSPSEPAPSPSPSPSPTPTTSPPPSPSPSPTETLEPTETPESTDEPGDDNGGERTERPDDDSSGSGSGGSGSSNSGSGSSGSGSDSDDGDDDHETPEPTDEPDDD